ncbi:MAG: hypothetical protein RLW62_04020 [Gammaproteobacteria bacterium]
MNEAGHEVPACFHVPRGQRTTLHRTNTLERLRWTRLVACVSRAEAASTTLRDLLTHFAASWP